MNLAKKTIVVIYMVLLLLNLISCSSPLEIHSLDEYIDEGGISHYSLDSPEYFLPSKTFFDDFEYIDGDCYCYQKSLFSLEDKPAISFLYLQYESDIYVDAKEYMQENIKSANGKIYEYNGYCFYINANFLADSGGHEFPEHFTAACYNDTKHILMFIGFYKSDPPLDEKYLNNIDETFGEFIEQYYGEYYDFSE